MIFAMYLTSFFLFLFDDTNIFLNGKNIDELVKYMNCELNKVVIWLAANKLSLNIKKTHFMIFRSKRCCIDNQQEFVTKKLILLSRPNFFGLTLIYLGVNIYPY